MSHASTKLSDFSPMDAGVKAICTCTASPLSRAKAAGATWKGPSLTPSSYTEVRKSTLDRAARRVGLMIGEHIAKAIQDHSLVGIHGL